MMTWLAGIGAAILVLQRHSEAFADPEPEPEPVITDPTPDQEALRQRWLQRSNEFVHHVAKFHAADSRVALLLASWKGLVVLRSTDGRAATFNKKLGRMSVNPGSKLNYVDEVMNTRILHELAHSSKGPESHGPVHRYTWTYFLRIATEELGWKCQISTFLCSEYSLCLRRLCPRCTWLDAQ